MKKARVEYRYDAPVHAIYPLLTGADRIVDRFTAQGAHDVELLEHEASGEALRLVSRYLVAVDVPGFARRILSPTSQVTHEEEWAPTPDGGLAGRFSIDIKGVPGSMTGTSALVPDPAGCRSVTDADIAVSVPLIGGRLEQMAVDRLHADLALVDGYLRSHVG